MLHRMLFYVQKDASNALLAIFVCKVVSSLSFYAGYEVLALIDIFVYPGHRIGLTITFEDMNKYALSNLQYQQKYMYQRLYHVYFSCD